MRRIDIFIKWVVMFKVFWHNVVSMRYKCAINDIFMLYLHMVYEKLYVMIIYTCKTSASTFFIFIFSLFIFSTDICCTEAWRWKTVKVWLLLSPSPISTLPRSMPYACTLGSQNIVSHPCLQAWVWTSCFLRRTVGRGRCFVLPTKASVSKRASITKAY